MNLLRRSLVFIVTLLVAAPTVAGATSIAREWNEELLEAIRHDLARPTVHARNLFHTSVAMWDAWAAYDEYARTYLHHEKATAADVAAARHETISYASYRVLSARFAGSVGAATTIPALDAKMDSLGYDKTFTSEVGATPAALGNRIAATVLAFGAADGSNEANDFANQYYLPVNPPILPDLPGNPDIVDPNRWQPIALDFFIDQAGNPIPGGYPEFLSPEWGIVTPFALSPDDLTIYNRDGFDYWVYHDPGPPPLLGSPTAEAYHTGFEQVLEWSSLLDPDDGVMLDISPNARGNNTLGTNDGSGYAQNPVTGLPYDPQIVPAGDYYRILAEFWADGPDSETPPGHWFTIANYVADHPLHVSRVFGVGPIVDELEWDVKTYLTLGGAMHDVAVASWGVKGWYDFVRPVSAIRYTAGLGQRSDPLQPSYHPDGIALEPGRVEVVTLATVAPGERHEHLAGPGNENVGKIAARAWRGPDFITDPDTDKAGVGWILVEDWWPYQRPSFVTPPFAGYVSGHSTYSRAAAEVLTALTGDPFFPGGIGEFEAPQNQFLVFEEGPSVDVTLQWAKYADAADECSLSRIYGGIHPTADDIPGRFMGSVMGPDAVAKAKLYFGSYPSITIQRATAWPRRQDRGKISLKGTLATGLYGEDDILDVSGGFTVTVTDGLTMEEAATVDAEDCVTKKNGKIRCVTDDKNVKVVFKPSKRVEGEYAVTLKIKKRNFGDPVDGPVRFDLAAGDVQWAGIIDSCIGFNAKLRCK